MIAETRKTTFIFVSLAILCQVAKLNSAYISIIVLVQCIAHAYCFVHDPEVSLYEILTVVIHQSIYISDQNFDVL